MLQGGQLTARNTPRLRPIRWKKTLRMGVVVALGRGASETPHSVRASCTLSAAGDGCLRRVGRMPPPLSPRLRRHEYCQVPCFRDELMAFPGGDRSCRLCRRSAWPCDAGRVCGDARPVRRADGADHLQQPTPRDVIAWDPPGARLVGSSWWWWWWWWWWYPSNLQPLLSGGPGTRRERSGASHPPSGLVLSATRPSHAIPFLANVFGWLDGCRLPVRWAVL